MSQEENKSLDSLTTVSDQKDQSNKKNDTMWKKRVNFFRLVYAYLQTHKDANELIQDAELINPNENGVDQKALLDDVISHYDEYATEVAKYLKPGWTFDRINDIEKALFLCALAEFNVLHTDKKVIIDQAIITCKKYDNLQAYKFVNAILDKLLVVHLDDEKADN